MNNFKDLKVWKKAISHVTKIYTLSKDFPPEELYGLTTQLRRSAISIPSNIAEGAGRGSKNEFKHFLSIALGSSFELDTQLMISFNLSFVKQGDYNLIESELIEIQKMIRGLQKSLK